MNTPRECKRQLPRQRAGHEKGRLTARPAAPTEPPFIEPGSHTLGIGAERDGLLYLPPSYEPDRPLPLVVMLHGAGASGRDVLGLLGAQADRHGLALLLPDSRAATWDLLLGGLGPDVAFIDAALAEVFERCPIATKPLAVAGFSDGASYGLSLGLANGDLFTHVLAFSPGFAAPSLQVGKPKIFVSHGTTDPVLPIERCSRVLVPRLERAGYEVLYEEFEGGHTVPAEVAEHAVRWMLGR